MKVNSSWKLRAIMISVAASLLAVGVISELTGTGTGLDFGFDFGTFMVMLTLLLIVGIGFLQSNIELRPDGIQLSLFPIYRKLISYDELSEINAVPLPLSRYGLGLRLYGSGDMGIISRSGHGVYLALADRTGGYYVSTGSDENAVALVREFNKIREASSAQGT